MKVYTILFAAIIFFTGIPVFADGMSDNSKTLSGEVSNPLVEAQEKLMHAKGSYKTIKQQESAIENMRKATRLSLKAAKLRTRAEKLQSKADTLVTKANQTALNRGLYITNPLAPVMMQPPPEAKTASAPSIVPVPGQAINIVIPKQEEVSYDQSGNNSLPEPPTVSDY